MAQRLLEQLREQDVFNLLLFASSTQQLSSESVTASEANVERALDMLNDTQSGGGTNLLQALQYVLRMPAAEGLSRSAIVITDGAIGMDNQTLRYIRQNLGQLNLFAFGIGNWINHQNIEALARAGRGQSFMFTRDDREFDQRLDQFLEYVANPVFTDITVDFPESFITEAVTPAAIPDVFSQRPVYVVGKWQGRPAGDMRISGYSGDAPYSANYPLQSAPAGESNAVIRLLWARERLQTLYDNERIGGANHRAEITELGLRHNLLTPYTSFVAVDEVVRNTALPTVDPRDFTDARNLSSPQAVSAPIVGMGMTNAMISHQFSAAPPSAMPLGGSRVSQRDELPLASDPSRPSVTFILGEDRDQTNPYYAAASAFFNTQNKGQVVQGLNTLAAVREWLTTQQPQQGAWGVVNIVVHGSPWTGLGVGIDSQPLPGSTPLDLGPAVSASEGVPDKRLDRHSQIRLFACGLGATPAVLQQLARYFGGSRNRPMVVSPSTPVVFQFDPATSKAEMAAWPHWWVASSGRQGLKHKDLAAQLHNRYGAGPWQSLIEQPLTAGLARVIEQPVRLQVAIPDTGFVPGRIHPRRLVAGQAALSQYLQQISIDPADLRWSLQRSDQQILLVGEGWVQQVITRPEEMTAGTAPYTVVASP
ncbi:MAG: hypothetical protein Tsb002_27980 [Wenzhouxiangellaceae bacterium]